LAAVDSFDLDALERALAGTIYAGNLHYSSITESTNTDALGAGRQGAPDGSIFFADEQRSGRGRSDHRWESAACEGLYVSVLVRPQRQSFAAHLLPLAAGIAAAEAIAEVAAIQVDLRWPNDLLIGSRKIGGILVEAKTEGSALRFAVAGVGINIHQHKFAGDMATPATSIAIETDHAVSRQTLLISLLKSLENEVSALHDPVAAMEIIERVEHCSSWVRGRLVKVHGPQACTGFTAGLNERGFLLVETQAGIMTVQTGGIRAVESD
jgi:BirA family biotin operon repressor/biotin-[acetyl-CoA-carboxylase] ligase